MKWIFRSSLHVSSTGSFEKNYVLNQSCSTGDDGSGDEPQQGILVKESESHYSLWCSGRVNCEGLLVELKVSRLQQQSLISAILSWAAPILFYLSLHLSIPFGSWHT